MIVNYGSPISVHFCENTLGEDTVQDMVCFLGRPRARRHSGNTPLLIPFEVNDSFFALCQILASSGAGRGRLASVLLSLRLQVAVLVALLTLFFPVHTTYAADDTGPVYEEQESTHKNFFNTGISFFDDAKMGGGLYYFQRKRQRFNMQKNDWKNNLDHATIQGAINFDSGYLDDVVGFDVGAFFSDDIRHKAAVDHEMNFVPWGNPWNPDWSKTDTVDGWSLYKANLKLKLGPAWGRAGYLQPTGPSTLGVNWSIMPGTYQGAEAGAKFGGLEFSGIVVNGYKAPWFKEIFKFKRGDGSTKVDYLWSMGARYTFDNGFKIEAAYGESEGYMKNWHGKAEYPFELGPGKLNLKYHYYAMADTDDDGGPNDHFDGLAQQHYLGAFYDADMWHFRADFTYTRAPMNNPGQLGYFAYRLTVPNGSSKGNYEVWWNARSDWDHDGEKAAFVGISRDLDDLLPLEGFNIGIGYAFGFDGQTYGHAQHLKEQAWTADASYTHKKSGPLEGAFVRFHFTAYYNETDLPDWEGYKNAFQNEKDYILMVGIPF